ncbi:MAG: hypothetical protein HDS82_07525 [Bacteroidales bacterium]|nr:hypothetical protein [Bacteroidales bacterium]
MQLRFMTPLVLAAMVAVWPGMSQAAPVSPDKALELALQARTRAEGVRKAPAAISPSIVMTRSAGSLSSAIYAVDFGADSGFAIVAGDDKAPAILGFADNGAFNPAAIPPALEAMLGEYAVMVAQVAEGETQPYEPVRLPGRKEIEPIVKSTWNQTAPYNAYCPKTGGYDRAPVGCVALSVGQIMRSHQWPPKSRGTVTYDAGKFRFNTEYDWASMPDSGLNLPSSETDNMAKMLYELARSIYMTFTGSSSGTYSYYVPEALVLNFSYDPMADYRNRNFYSDSQWEELVYSQLAAGQPMAYDGMAVGEGHSFVCDGYRDGYFHINWGWEGKSDGYFLLSHLDPEEQGVGGASSGFFRRHGIICNVRPPKGGTQPMRLSMTGSLQQGEIPNTFRVADYEFDGWGIEEGIFNLTGRDFSATLGLKAVNVADPSKVEYFFEASPREWVRWFTRAPFINVDITSLADGRYYIYPVAKDELGAISDIQCPSVRTRVLEAVIEGGSYACKEVTADGGAPVGVAGEGGYNDETAAVHSVDMVLQPGEYGQLYAYIAPLDAAGELEWSSSDNDVAVALDGMVIARGKIGKAVITASVKDNPGLFHSFVVEVESPVIITSLEFAKDKEYVFPGESVRLSAVLSPEKVSNSHLKFSSSDEDIAKVDDNGVVTAGETQGTVEITATTIDGSELTAVCIVEVSNENAVECIGESVADNGPAPVYTATGIKVAEGVSTEEEVMSLPEGIYIWRGHKFIVRR